MTEKKDYQTSTKRKKKSVGQTRSIDRKRTKKFPEKSKIAELESNIRTAIKGFDLSTELVRFDRSESTLVLYTKGQCKFCKSPYYRDVCLYALQDQLHVNLKNDFPWVHHLKIIKPCDENFKSYHQTFDKGENFTFPTTASKEEITDILYKHPLIDSNWKAIKYIGEEEKKPKYNNQLNFVDFLKTHVVIWKLDENTTMVLKNGITVKGCQDILKNNRYWWNGIDVRKVNNNFIIYTCGKNKAFDFYQQRFFRNLCSRK